ncbi:ATP synthase delta chain [Striga asiatica]|uniref:ATP synthase delta chain n=1 Tax=Striga asiatica TaxID=4170 RepID=A0A5A7QCB6_STRAF|nr:ATP synthase delta chain [Striga asiatica]
MEQVDMVTVPSTTGQMSVLPGHVPLISELKSGLLSIHEGDEVTNYFISTGFAFVHSDSITDILAVEAVPIEHVDPASVQKALREFTQRLDSASTDIEKTEARIAVDVLSALNSSLRVELECMHLVDIKYVLHLGNLTSVPINDRGYLEVIDTSREKPRRRPIRSKNYLLRSRKTSEINQDTDIARQADFDPTDVTLVTQTEARPC